MEILLVVGLAVAALAAFLFLNRGSNSAEADTPADSTPDQPQRRPGPPSNEELR